MHGWSTLRGLDRRVKEALEGWTLGRAYHLLTGAGEARRIWLQHIGQQKAPHAFDGCPPCEMARALRLPRNWADRWWQ